MNNILEVKNVTMRFGGLTAINNVSLAIEEGSLVGLIGPNGAGKTTFFNVVTGVYAPTEGDVLFEGSSMAGMAPHLVCKLGTSRTFQNIRLFKEMTVLENLLVSLHPGRGYGFLEAVTKLGRFNHREREMREEARAILDDLGLAAKQDSLAKNLPYGDQRKVEIARALAAHPKLLLLDEPAAGMNPSETAQLSQFIQEIRQKYKVTVLLIEHDMSLVMKICEHLYVLDYGELIAQGLPAEIKNNKRVIEAYLGGSVGNA